MAEEMVRLFIVMKLKIIFNFICQGSAPFFAMKGAQIFSRAKRGDKTGGQWGVSTFLLDYLRSEERTSSQLAGSKSTSPCKVY